MLDHGISLVCCWEIIAKFVYYNNCSLYYFKFLSVVLATSCHRLFIIQWQTQDRTIDNGIEQSFPVEAIILTQIVGVEIEEKIVQEGMKTMQVIFIIKKTQYLFFETFIIIFQKRRKIIILDLHKMKIHPMSIALIRVGNITSQLKASIL